MTIEPESSDSTVHSASAILQYQATDEGSMINVVEAEPESDDEDEGLRDFLNNLGG